MGVRGLKTYLERYCPDACYEVDIAELVSDHEYVLHETVTYLFEILIDLVEINANKLCPLIDHLMFKSMKTVGRLTSCAIKFFS